MEWVLLMAHPDPLYNARAPFPPLLGFWQPTADPFPKLTRRGAYVLSSTTQVSPQPITDSRFFASRGDHLCAAVNSPEHPIGSATGQPRVHLCSAPSPDAPFPSLLSSSGLRSRNHMRLNTTSGSASGEPDLRHRGKLYSGKRLTIKS